MPSDRHPSDYQATVAADFAWWFPRFALGLLTAAAVAAAVFVAGMYAAGLVRQLFVAMEGA